MATLLMYLLLMSVSVYEGWIGTKISMGNVTCFRAMSYVIGLCLMSSGRMFSGNTLCVDRAHVFRQCFLCTIGVEYGGAECL